MTKREAIDLLQKHVCDLVMGSDTDQMLAKDWFMLYRYPSFWERAWPKKGSFLKCCYVLGLSWTVFKLNIIEIVLTEENNQPKPKLYVVH